MNEINFPTQSTKTLIKASIAATIIAAIVFVTLILPSEYNIDPTGVGKSLGLTVLAEPVQAEEPDAVAGEGGEKKAILKKDMTTIVVPAGKGLEYKFYLEQFADIDYEWKTDGTALKFDFHGEPEGDTTGYYKTFVKAKNSEMKGSMTVPFTGSHGWFWRNETDKDVVITLTTEGQYKVLGNPRK
jgi:hypothetical protein